MPKMTKWLHNLLLVFADNYTVEIETVKPAYDFHTVMAIYQNVDRRSAHHWR